MTKQPVEASRLARLERLADSLEIREVLTRYCRALDRRDYDLAASCFHADSTENHGNFVGKSLDFLKSTLPRMANFEATVRHLTNVTIELNGDTAFSEACWLTALRDATSDLIYSGRYIDRFERRDHEWKIGARLATVDWWRRELRSAESFPGAPEILRWVGRGLEDSEVQAAIEPRS